MQRLRIVDNSSRCRCNVKGQALAGIASAAASLRVNDDVLIQGNTVTRRPRGGTRESGWGSEHSQNSQILDNVDQRVHGGAHGMQRLRHRRIEPVTRSTSSAATPCTDNAGDGIHVAAGATRQHLRAQQIHGSGDRDYRRRRAATEHGVCRSMCGRANDCQTDYPESARSALP